MQHEDDFIRDPAIMYAPFNDAQIQSKGRMGITTINTEVFGTDFKDTSLSSIILRISEMSTFKDEREIEIFGEDGKRLSVLGTPDHLNQISVEPLHFLGIKPTSEKAALLSACKSLHAYFSHSLKQSSREAPH